jgi:hypothetical protein
MEFGLYWLKFKENACFECLNGGCENFCHEKPLQLTFMTKKTTAIIWLMTLVTFFSTPRPTAS